MYSGALMERTHLVTNNSCNEPRGRDFFVLCNDHCLVLRPRPRGRKFQNRRVVARGTTVGGWMRILRLQDTLFLKNTLKNISASLKTNVVW